MPIISFPLTTDKKQPFFKKSQILVDVGDKVSRGQVLAVNLEYETAEINLARDLKVKGAQINEYLLKRKGDKVRAGDILASKKNLLGTKILKSPVAGQISGWDKEGVMQIQVIQNSREIKSWVNGSVADKNPQEITVEFNGEEIEGIFGFGNKEGVLKAAPNRGETVDFYSLDKEFKNCLVLGRQWEEETITKALALECGIIGTNFSSWEIAAFPNQNNFAILKVNPENFRKVENLLNKEVFLAGEIKKLIYQP